MSDKTLIISDEIKKSIQEISNGLLSDLKLESAIKDGIFDVLESKCTVIYYPLENEKNRGFHIQRYMKDQLEDFVFINSDKTVEQQVFTAAHELGHVIGVYKSVCKKIENNGINLATDNLEFEEIVVNRFAAELVMPEEMFANETNTVADELGINGEVSIIELLKLIARLMDKFMSPFNAVRKRLREVHAIDSEADRFLSQEKENLERLIDLLKRDDNRLINSNTRVKTISGLRELIDTASNNPNIDPILICKIKKDFDVKEVSYNTMHDIRFSGAKID